MGRAPALLAALLVGVSPLAVMAGQEARMYPLVGMLAVGATLALASAVERGGTRRWACYAGLAALLVYTHYFGGLVLLAHGVWVAGWERPHLRPWAIGIAAVALLYAPWMPAVWEQSVQHTSRAYTSGWFHGRDPTLDLGAAFGLLAFGGSLLGAAGYFGGGHLGVAQQCLTLLPFLAVFWRGVARLAGRPESLALVGLPLFIAAACMFAGSLVRAAVFPRQFSFLVPFYAMVLAIGIFDIAAHCRRGSLAAAFLTAGCVLAGVPALGRYYVDPHARLYEWRAAAAFVESEARRGDAFVYVGWEPDIALGYYLREPHPSLVLFPIESFGGPRRSPSFGSGQAHELASRFPRSWLIITTPTSPADPYMQRRLFPELSTAFRIPRPREFGGIWVYRLEAHHPVAR